MLVEAILDRKGSDILLLDMREQCIFADYFLICSADSDRQIKAIANAIRADAKESAREIAMSVEGKAEDGWMLVDFGHVVCHIFNPDRRAYYDLEELWQDTHVVLRMP